MCSIIIKVFITDKINMHKYINIKGLNYIKKDIFIHIK